jgi:hypothetical protein
MRSLKPILPITFAGSFNHNIKTAAGSSDDLLAFCPLPEEGGTPLQAFDPEHGYCPIQSSSAIIPRVNSKTTRILNNEDENLFSCPRISRTMSLLTIAEDPRQDLTSCYR